jgi:N-acetylneuraminic acid mutarotase
MPHRTSTLVLGLVWCSCCAAAGQWAPANPSPVVRLEGAAAVVGGRIYAFGGFGAAFEAQTAVDVFDPLTGNWTALAPMPRGVTHSQAAVVGNRVYIAGGFEGSNPGTAIADVMVYDVGTNTWSTTSMPDLPAPRASGALVALGTRIHYLSGLQANRCTDVTDHLVLDTANPGAGWTNLAPLPETKNHFNAVVVGGSIYAVGGQRGHDCGIVYLRSSQRYDPQSNAWTTLPDMPVERSHHEPSLFAWNGFVVAGGGTNSAEPAMASVVAYDIARERWVRWPDLPGARRSPILQRIGNQVYFGTGGALPGGVIPTADFQANRVRTDAPRVLFVRGAARSGGFLEATNDAQRTEQLADIDNTGGAGNHGWGELRATLESEGFLPAQVAETAETPTGPAGGVHVDLELAHLGDLSVVVFGSNNAPYDVAAVNAIEAYVRNGGGALFVSDANFGGDWADAPGSDQAFLDRFGLVMNQDFGTYTLTRAGGDFLSPLHPILAGVDAFDGEGVSPGVRGVPVAGVASTVLARAIGQTRVNTPPFGAQNQGALRAVAASDAALLVASADQGRVAIHFDRNTFFNAGGVGTDLTRFDNRTYAINLFDWLAQGPADPAFFSDGFED